MDIMVPERNLDNTSSHPYTIKKCLVEDAVAPLPCERGSFDFQEEKKDPMTPTRNKDGDTISNAKPAITDIPRPPLLRRAQSEQPPKRRPIFRNCWHQGVPKRRPRSSSDATNSNCPSTPPPIPSKFSAISIPERLSPKIKEMDINQLTPPNLCMAISSERFRPVKEMPQHVASELPRIPYPLKRFFDEDGKGACLNGAYPMNSPQPILKQSTYNNSSNEEQGSPFGPFNLTETNHGFDGSDRDANSSVGRRSSSFSSNNSEKRHVQFDPRVTVTEFFDEDERQWFSEAELDRFRNQTIFVAQQFLLKHPEKIADYSNPVLDPVTRTMRKKALFSLEVFRADSSDTEDAEAVVDEVGRDNARQLAGHEVRKILIVDRNALIVNLFCRSMQVLFPAASISSFQTAEDALQAYERARYDASHGLARSFDLVIAEERLHKPLQRTEWRLRGGNKTRSFPKNLSDSRSTGWATWGSLNNLSTIEEKPSMSGSELFHKINSADESLSKDSSRQAAPAAPVEASSLAPIQWRPLLIGVSMQPAEDASKFFDSGADFVWGKPPPSMNDTLRDQLVASLVKKRGEIGVTFTN